MGRLVLALRVADLRRLLAAWTLSSLGQWAAQVGLHVYLFRRFGPAAVGGELALRTFPAGVLAPVLGAIADRRGRRTMMLVADLTRVASFAAAGALVAAGGPLWALLLPSIVWGLATSGFMPAQQALIPALVTDPELLLAANTALGTIDAVGFTAGSGIGGALLVLFHPQTVLFLAAGMLALSAANVLAIRARRALVEPAAQFGNGTATGDVELGLIARTRAGLVLVAREPRLRTIIGLIGAQAIIAAALAVLIVPLSLSTLGGGPASLGVLMTGLGAGGLVGAAIALRAATTRRLVRVFAIGIVLWAVGVAALALPEGIAGAVAVLALCGIANTLVDAFGHTLIQEAAPDHAMARVFAALEMAIAAAAAVGALGTPVAISLLGVRGACVAFGALLVGLTAIALPSLRGLDRAGTRATVPATAAKTTGAASA